MYTNEFFTVDSAMTAAAHATPSPLVSFVILADRAEAINGKLYLMGGCWGRLQLPTFPVAYSVGLAASIEFPAGTTPGRHVVAFKITGPGVPSLVPNGVEFDLQAVAPRSERALIALAAIATLPEAGEYVIEVTVDGSGGSTTHFSAEQSLISE